MATKTTLQNRDSLALERQVCFALEITTRAVLAVYRPLLEPLGLTHPQRLVMLTLWGHPRSSPEPRSVKQITTAPQLDSATLWPMLKCLEVRGLITRSRGTTGESTTHVKLTADGVALRRRALKIPPAVVERLGVDLDKLEPLHEVLTRINAAALAAGPFADEWIYRRRDRKVLQYLAYSFGRKLPDSMQAWVRNDLTCHQPGQPRVPAELARSAEGTEGAPPRHLRRMRNLFAAGIPVNLDRAITVGQLKKGDVVMMAAFASAGDFAGGVVKWGGRL